MTEHRGALTSEGELYPSPPRGIAYLEAALEEVTGMLNRKERERVWDDVQAKEKEGKMTEDEKFRAKEELQKIIDEANKNLEAIFDRKEKEVMG